MLDQLKMSLIKILNRPRLVEILGRPKRLSPFNPGKHPLIHRVRAFYHGRCILGLLSLGYGVVVIGRCRTGKSYLLGKTAPLSVIKPDIGLILQGHRPEKMDYRNLPEGYLAVDEPFRFDWTERSEIFDVLRGRKVMFTVQSLSILTELQLHVLFENRLKVIFLGSKDDFQREFRGTSFLHALAPNRPKFSSWRFPNEH